MSRLRKIDKQRLASHIRDWQEEIDRITTELTKLSAFVTSDYSTYTKVRRLQAARQIMQDQLRDMEQVLRRNGT